MGSVAGGALARAVTRAGGLGLIGAGYADGRTILQEFQAAQGERVGIGFITWDLAQRPERLTAALQQKPALVQLSFGDAEPYLSEIKRAGALIALQVQTLDAALRAAELGADIIVAQGSEAGGHGAARGLFSLLPAIVDRVTPLPVVAAGGVADGRGLIAALALGASGVLLGTRFVATQEALASSAAKAEIVAASGDATLRTRVFDIVRGIDWPAPYTGRALQNQFTQRWHGRERELQEALALEAPRYAEATRAEQFETALIWSGEGCDLIQDVPPAGELVRRIVAEARAASAHVASL